MRCSTDQTQTSSHSFAQLSSHADECVHATRRQRGRDVITQMKQRITPHSHYQEHYHSNSPSPRRTHKVRSTLIICKNSNDSVETNSNSKRTPKQQRISLSSSRNSSIA